MVDSPIQGRVQGNIDFNRIEFYIMIVFGALHTWGVLWETKKLPHDQGNQ